MSIDNSLLQSGYAHLQNGSIYKKWAPANPGEAAKLDSYIKGLLAGLNPSPPALASETGRGFVDWVGMFDNEVAPPPPPPPTLTVTQSIPSGAILTAPTKWSVTPSAAVVKVEFRIDGSLRWTENVSPYVFNGDASFLDPATLPNGPHILMATAISGDGTSASVSSTVTVNVTAPPPPPPPAPGLLPRYGISTGSVYTSWGAATRDYAIGRMVDLAGGKPFAVRYDCWVMDAQFIDFTDRCLNAGLTPYIVLYSTTSPSGSHDMTLGQKIAARWKGKGLVFTGPNEPDLNGWGADQLADFQKQVYASVKSGDPAALCGFGALWKGGPGPQAYVKSLIARAKTSLDFASFHAKEPPSWRDPGNPWDQWLPGGWYPADQTCKGLLAAAGINVPIVDDEAGANKGPNQGVELTAQLQQVSSGRCDGAYVFSLLVDNDPGKEIINADHTYQPGYPVLKSFASA